MTAMHKRGRLEEDVFQSAGSARPLLFGSPVGFVKVVVRKSPQIGWLADVS